MKKKHYNNDRLFMVSFAIIAIFIWMSFDFLTSVLDAANIKIVTSIHNAVVHPVRVKFSGLDDEQLSLVRVYRVSPKGNRSLYRLNDGVFYKEAKYFSDIEIEITGSDVPDFRSIIIDIGSKEYTVLSESLTRENKSDLTDSDFTYSLVKILDLDKSNSFIPQFSGLINYRGDIQMIMLIFPRTAVPVIVSLIFFPWWAKYTAVFLFLLSWFVIALAGALLSPAYLQVRPLYLTYFLIAVRNIFYITFLYSAVKIMLQKNNTGIDREPDEKKVKWRYVVILILLFVTAFLLRVFNLNYMQGVDTFNLISARSFNDTGVFSYPRNWDITYMLAWVFRTFGTTLFAARIPFVLLSLAVMGLVGFMLRPFGKKAVLIGLLLYAISPVAIEKASVIREYGINIFLVSIICTMLLFIYLRFRKNVLKTALHMTVCLVFFSIAILLYGPAARNVTVNTSLQASGFFYISLITVLLWNSYPTWRKIIIAIFLAGVAAVFLIAPVIGPFSGRFRPSFNFLFFYFNPMVHHPMQWFSFQSIGLALPLVLSFFSLFNSKNRDIITACFLTFFGSIALFSVYMGNTVRSRYLYHIFPFYIILITLGLIWLWNMISSFSLKMTPKKQYFYKILFLSGCLLIFWIPNTFIAAKHEIPSGQDRDVTSFGYRDYFRDFYEYLKERELTESDALVLETHRPDLLCWLLDRPINNKYVIKRGSYDISENMYLENVYGVKQLEDAVGKHERGYFITRNVAYDRSPVIVDNTKLEYLTTIEKHSFYVWDKNSK